jgi:hypothetical protein
MVRTVQILKFLTAAWSRGLGVRLIHSSHPCCTMTPALQVLVYTVNELMEIGLLLEGESIERQKRQQRKTLVDDFKF